MKTVVKARCAVNAVVISPAAAATAVSGENGGENKICCECCGDFRSWFHHIGCLPGPEGFVYSYISYIWVIYGLVSGASLGVR